MTTDKNKSRQYGFSLTELMVVVAVIGILMGLSFPTVGYVRNRARRVACLNNMRQWGIALQQYFDDHRGKMPVCPNEPSPSITTAGAWFNVLPPYMGTTPMKDMQSVPRPGSGARSEFLCPTDYANFDEENTASTSYYSSYSFNAALIESGKRITSIKRAANFIVMGEAAEGSKSGLTTEDLDFRHDKQMNAVFADGHASAISLSETISSGTVGQSDFGIYQWNPEQTK